jgi:hypothetical protein
MRWDIFETIYFNLSPHPLSLGKRGKVRKRREEI